MSEEAVLQGQVTELCDLLGITWWHDTDSRRNKSGLPDLILIGKAVLWVELKSTQGKLRPGQVEMLDRLHYAGQDVCVWRPEHWTSGAIRRRLQALRPDAAPAPRPSLPQARRPRASTRRASPRTPT